MSEGTRPSLLQLGGSEDFAAYEKEFGRLYRNQRIFDVLGNQVRFDRNVCWHVCTKDSEGNRSGQRREWVRERAERIPWILPALTHPLTEIRPDEIANRWNYLLIVDADPQNGLPQEYYCVVVEKLTPGVVTLVTAFPTDHAGWSKRKKNGKALYPKKQKDQA